MQVKQVTIPYSRPDKFSLYTLGDAHDGTKHFSKSEFLKTVKKIGDDPLALWVDMADKCEFIAPSDPRWDGGAVADWVHPDNVALNESDDYISLVEPIKEKCLGMLEGNHEIALKKHYHIDVQDYICKSLGVTNLGYSAFIKFIFTRGKEHHEIVGYFTHGAGGAITKGAKVNRLDRVMDSFAADIYAHGHVHDIITNQKAYLALNSENKIVQRVKVGAMTGCFFRTYSQDIPASYGEQKNYPPTTMGCPVFTIMPDKGLISVTGI
jgi:hypothetical protein